MSNDMVLWLEEVGKEDIAIVGGKGASLGEMIQAELPGPKRFTVTTKAFRKFVNKTGIGIDNFVHLEPNAGDYEKLKEEKKNIKFIEKESNHIKKHKSRQNKPKKPGKNNNNNSTQSAMKPVINYFSCILAASLVMAMFMFPEYRNEAVLILIIQILVLYIIARDELLCLTINNIVAGILITVIFVKPEYRNEALLLLIILALFTLIYYMSSTKNIHKKIDVKYFKK